MQWAQVQNPLGADEAQTWRSGRFARRPAGSQAPVHFIFCLSFFSSFNHQFLKRLHGRQTGRHALGEFTLASPASCVCKCVSILRFFRDVMAGTPSHGAAQTPHEQTDTVSAASVLIFRGPHMSFAIRTATRSRSQQHWPSRRRGGALHLRPHTTRMSCV